MCDRNVPKSTVPGFCVQGELVQPLGFGKSVVGGSIYENSGFDKAKFDCRCCIGGVAAVLTLGMPAPAAPAFAEDAPATDQAAVLEQNQKTATELDENLETNVTLSFPGKREAEPADVVFVLDKSGASAEKDIYNQAKSFLEEVKAKAQADGLDIRVGVVLFEKAGNIKQ